MLIFISRKIVRRENVSVITFVCLLYVSVILQIFSLLSSWITVAWVLVGFQRALRLSHYPDRAPLTRPGMAAQFAWRLFTTAARVLAFVMFASHFKAFLFAIVGGHWMLMLACMCLQHTDYCTLQSSSGKKHPSCFLEMLFRMMAAFIHIFCFFNLIGGHTRLRALVFYTLIYIENAIMIVAWYIGGSTQFEQTWYVVPVFVMVFVGFLCGILFMFIYYVYCHPNKHSTNPRHQKIKPWVKCEHLSLFKDPDIVDQTLSETDQSSLMTQGLQNMPAGTSTPNGFQSPEYPSQPTVPLAGPYIMQKDNNRAPVSVAGNTSYNAAVQENNNKVRPPDSRVIVAPSVVGKQSLPPVNARVSPVFNRPQPPNSLPVVVSPSNQKQEPLMRNSSNQKEENPTKRLTNQKEAPVGPTVQSAQKLSSSQPEQVRRPRRPLVKAKPPGANFDVQEKNPSVAFKVTSV